MKTITAFGDSVLKGVINVEGRYKLAKDSFSRLCETILGIQVVNKAMIGCTITKGKQIFENSLNAVLESTGNTVILEFGGNDCDYDWPVIDENPEMCAEPRNTLETFKNEYLRLLNRIKEIGKEPIILSLPPIDPIKYFNWISRNLNKENILKFLGGKIDYLKDWHEMYNLELFKIAYQSGVKIIDITSCFLKNKDYTELLCVDGIHPNEKGHSLIAGVICGSLT